MILAHEAKKKTEETINNETFKELALLEKEIKEAISNGEYRICHEGSISKETEKKLVEFGYQVSHDSQYNESYVIIRWDSILRSVNS